MAIHRNYARLSAADRAVVDDAFQAVRMAFATMNRATSNVDPAERLVEALATYMIESDGAARVGDGDTLTAPEGRVHPSYEADFDAPAAPDEAEGAIPGWSMPYADKAAEYGWKLERLSDGLIVAMPADGETHGWGDYDDPGAEIMENINRVCDMPLPGAQPDGIDDNAYVATCRKALALTGGAGA